MADPNFANVVLLCHFDGVDQQTTTVDSSSFHRTVGLTGSKLVTASAKFGASSLTQGVGQYANIADSADWDFGAGQFTVEAFVYPTATISGSRAIVVQWSGGNFAWFFGFNGNTLNFFYSTTGADFPTVTGAYTPTLNQWIHIAADRDASNVLRIYVDGVVIASATVSSTFFNSTTFLQIGNDGTTTKNFVGNIDEVRITKGVARYGGAFTPPTEQFFDTTNAQIAGLAREALVAATGTLNVAGIAREVLGDFPVQATVQGIVREVVGASPGAVQVRGLVRELVVVPGGTTAVVQGLVRELVGATPYPVTVKKWKQYAVTLNV